ncbi:murein hydrolase activator EnvC [Pantoea sp. 1.19]|uniref:murein hydrolase activator EnvC n=1 Tax=Pantoea sp. 1.19 TaxID=1925589 RepID=UPI000948B2A6|nr:murein hydrolase activator EnvC [Pantoea sp. 1.19]
MRDKPTLFLRRAVRLAAPRTAQARRLCASVLCAGYLLLPALSAANDSQSQLKSIQQDIAETEQRVKAQKVARSNLLDQLRSQEKIIAQAARQLRDAQQALATLNKEISALNASITRLESQQTHQEQLLSQQLDAAFRQGQHGSMQLILGGEESQRSERILAYFGYLNAARQQTIGDLQQTRRQLSAQKAEQIEKQARQRQLLDGQKRQQQKLESARIARQKTLTTLESALEKDQADLVEMRQNETRLRDKIARAEQAARARAEREAEQVRQRQAQEKSKGSSWKPSASERSLMARTGGLGRPAGQDIWPVRGSLAHRFGETLQGELRWKGLVINAPEGAEVKAIADGRVLMADWLQGYGLVVVVEHGKGDMSLYGYNQSALVSVGAQVRAGEPIALVGTSGGRGTPSLYFEIRRQGQAVNPLPWLGR